jgi:protoporphyrinogen/coproporphyrinogen III oxidase
MQSKHKDVVVIGAGISGLVCAYRLKALGADVCVLEQTNRVGGVMESARIDEFLIEYGPNSSQGVPELLALIEETGISGELIEGTPKAPAYVYFAGRLRPVPMSPPTLISSDLLSLRGKLRLLREPFIDKRQSNQEESVVDFFSRRLGSEVAERLVAPFVSGIYAGDERRLSIQAAFPALARLENGNGSLFRGAIAKLGESRQARKTRTPDHLPKRKRSISFRDGMQVLPRALAGKLGQDLLKECLDISIAESPSQQLGSVQYAVNFRQTGLEYQITCDQLVIATPARNAAALLVTFSQELEQLLQEIEYPPLVILHMVYGKAGIANPLNGFGFLAAPVEKSKVLGCIFSSSQFAGRAPQDKALLTVFMGGARNPELCELSDDRLAATAHGELKKILGIQALPRILNITRWQRAIPQYNIGHAARVRRIESLTRRIDGVHLAGNYLHGVSVGDCVKEAQRVALEVSRSKT